MKTKSEIFETLRQTRIIMLSISADYLLEDNITEAKKYARKGIACSKGIVNLIRKERG